MLMWRAQTNAVWVGLGVESVEKAAEAMGATVI